MNESAGKSTIRHGVCFAAVRPATAFVLSILLLPAPLRAEIEIFGQEGAGASVSASTGTTPPGMEGGAVMDGESSAQAPGAAATESGGPPDGLTREDWLRWYDDRHDGLHANTAYLSIQSQYLAEGPVPMALCYYHPRVRDMVQDFNTWFYGLPRTTNAREIVGKLVEIVRDHLRNDDRECIGYAWFFYKVCQEVGYPVSEYRAYMFRPAYQGGHAFNRITLRGQTFVVDAFNDIIAPR